MQMHDRARSRRARHTYASAGTPPWSAVAADQAAVASKRDSAPDRARRARHWSASSASRRRQPDADVAGRAEGQAARENRSAERAQILARAVSLVAPCHHASQALRKKSGAPKLPDFSASAGRRADAARPGHAGVDLRPDRSARDAERLHDRARRLAAGDEQAARSPARAEPRRPRPSRPSTMVPDCSRPSIGLHGARPPRDRRSNRPGAGPIGRRGGRSNRRRLARGRRAVGDRERVDTKRGRPAAIAALDLAARRRRTGAGEDRGTARGRGETVRRRRSAAAPGLAEGGRPIATPEPPVTSGRSRAGRADARADARR